MGTCCVTGLQSKSRESQAGSPCMGTAHPFLRAAQCSGAGTCSRSRVGGLRRPALRARSIRKRGPARYSLAAASHTGAPGSGGERSVAGGLRRCGVVWCGVVWCGVVWCGVVWCGVVWCGVVFPGVPWWSLGVATKFRKSPRREVVRSSAGVGVVYPLFLGHSRSIPQGMIFDVQPLVKSLFCPIRPTPNGVLILRPLSPKTGYHFFERGGGGEGGGQKFSLRRLQAVGWSAVSCITIRPLVSWSQKFSPLLGAVSATDKKPKLRVSV